MKSCKEPDPRVFVSKEDRWAKYLEEKDVKFLPC